MRMHTIDKLKWRSACLGAALMMVLASGCRTVTPVRVLSISPEAASPGMIVELKSDRSFADLGSALRVEMGKTVATVQRKVGATEVEILVPNLPPGKVQVRLREEGKRASGAVPFEVLPAQALQVVLSMEGNQIRPVSVTPRGSQYATPAERDQRRLSYDVINDQGGLVFSGEIVHPVEGRKEIFDEPEPGQRIIRGATEQHAGVFVIKIPNLPAKSFTIRFFDVPPSLDLSTLEGRKGRRFINEIKIKP